MTETNDQIHDGLDELTDELYKTLLILHAPPDLITAVGALKKPVPLEELTELLRNFNEENEELPR